MSLRSAVPAIAVALAALLAACAASPRSPAAPPAAAAAAAAPAPAPTARYDDPTAWLCLPGRDDACKGDLSATVLHPDGSRTVEPSPPAAPDPKVDCFYVYPTVDLSPEPGNHEDFHDLGAISAVTLAQVGRFRQACAIYAPLYRQVTIGSYFHPDSLEPRLVFAYSDVEAAFRTYLAKYDRGRPIVLIGHSQGGDMVIRLLKEFFDHDAALRSRLVLGLPIGWYVEAPRGKTTGGTFENVPLCTSPDEAGCVIAYRSYEADAKIPSGGHTPSDGNVAACVNPAAVGSDALAPLSRAYLHATGMSRRYVHVEGVETPFVELDGFYRGQCVEGQGGNRYLAISRTPGDPRTNPVRYAKLPLYKYIGLHVLDLQLPQGDLVDLVAKHAAAVR